MKIVIYLVGAAMLGGCSSMATTTAQGIEHLNLRERGSFEIRVRTPSETLSAVVYEFAVRGLSKSLKIAEREPGRNTIEITFASQADSAYFGGSSTNASAMGSMAGWYTGNTYYARGAASGTATTISSGGSFTWQNSTLLMVVRDAGGNRLWTGDYNYKGGWELSGWSVNTPAEAARLCLDRLYEQMKKDGVL